jgi:hypothetical protein
MRLRGCSAVLVLVSMSIPGSLSAQTMLTLEIPVNLTKLHPDVQQVQANCNLYSAGIVVGTISSNNPTRVGRDQVPVMGGQVVSTFRVLFELPAEVMKDPIGKTANYECHLNGYTSKGWSGFSEDDPASPMYMKPAPKPITGSFVW